jgi:hypothetical protein
MSELYRHFARSWAQSLDFSDEALLSLYNHESYGTELSENNGFAVGKKYLNLQVTMWREDLRRGWLAKWELYETDLPNWWFDSILDGLYDNCTYVELMYECTKDFKFNINRPCSKETIMSEVQPNGIPADQLQEDADQVFPNQNESGTIDPLEPADTEKLKNIRNTKPGDEDTVGKDTVGQGQPTQQKVRQEPSLPPVSVPVEKNFENIDEFYDPLETERAQADRDSQDRGSAKAE